MSDNLSDVRSRRLARRAPHDALRGTAMDLPIGIVTVLLTDVEGPSASGSPTPSDGWGHDACNWPVDELYGVAVDLPAVELD